MQLRRNFKYPQYFSQQVPFWRQGHCFPHVGWQLHGEYCLHGRSFPSAILLHKDGWPADFHEDLTLRTLPLLRQILDLTGISGSWCIINKINYTFNSPNYVFNNEPSEKLISHSTNLTHRNSRCSSFFVPPKFRIRPFGDIRTINC